MENLRRNGNCEIEKPFKNILSNHAPVKIHIIRHKSRPFMTKNLTKEIIKTIQLKNVLNKNRNHASRCNYKSQRSDSGNPLRKTKTNYFKKLNVKSITHSKTFWKVIKSNFSDIGQVHKKFYWRKVMQFRLLLPQNLVIALV